MKKGNFLPILMKNRHFNILVVLLFFFKLSQVFLQIFCVVLSYTSQILIL